MQHCATPPHPLARSRVKCYFRLRVVIQKVIKWSLVQWCCMPRELPSHTDLIRAGRWTKLITEKTTEALPVFWHHSIMYQQHISQWKRIWLDLGFWNKAMTNFLMFWKCIFWAFLIVVHQKMSFLESWGKAGQLRHVSERTFCVWQFNLIWPDLKLTFLKVSWT